MTDDEIIAVLQARKEGKIIQTRSHFHPLEGWQNCTLVWDFYQNDYRVAPEPRKPRVLELLFEDYKVRSVLSLDGIPKSGVIRVQEVIE